MKQLLFLLIFPCLALAQYPNNGNQKITLGEQTTADGLVFRGVANDTNVITPFSDTSAYIILDTANSKFYHYNRTTTYWALAGGGGGSTLDTATMLLPYYRAGRNGIIQAADVPTLNQNTTGSAATLTTARNIRTNLASAFGANFDGSANITPGVTGVLGAGNGGTGASNFGSPNRIPFVSSSGSLTTDTFFAYNGTTQRLGVGVPNPTEKLHVDGNGLFTGSMSLGTPLTVANGGTNTSTAFRNGSVVFAGASGTYAQDSSGLFYNSTNKRLAVGQSQNLSGAALSLRGGLHFIDPDTTVFSDALMYIYPKEQITSGPNASEFSMFMAGPGSSSTNDGPQIIFRGNNYSRVSNQRGFMFFGSGTNVPAAGNNGTIQFYAQHGLTFTGASTFSSLAGTGSRTVLADANGLLSAPTSSITTKENVQVLNYGLNEILQINPVSFDYINKDKWGEERNLGFIVEDMYPIVPEVTGTMNNGDMYLDMVKLIPVLTKAIQEQNALIKALEQRLLILENK